MAFTPKDDKSETTSFRMDHLRSSGVTDPSRIARDRRVESLLRVEPASS